MSEAKTRIDLVITALVLVAIIMSGVTLYYAAGIAGVKTDVSDLKTATGDLATIVGDLTTAVDDLTTKVADIRTTVANLTAIVADLATTVGASTVEIVALQARLADLEVELADLETRLADLETRLAAVEDLLKPPKVVFTVHGWWKPPPASHYNGFIWGVFPSGFVYERLAFWMRGAGEPAQFVPELATSWEITPLNLTANIREGVVWHDGEPFTSKDVWTTFMIGKAFDWGVWEYIDEIETPNDLTVIFTLKTTYIMTPISVLNQWLFAPYHIYGAFADRVAAGVEDLADIKNDVMDFRPAELVGTGPFKLKTITESEAVLEKNLDHFAADIIGIDEVSLPVILSNEVGWAYYLGDSIDSDWFFMPESVENEVAAKPWGNVKRVSDLAGGALAFNHQHEWLSDVRVRQAIAYAIDVDPAVALPWKKITLPTGILEAFVDDWLTPTEKAALDSYAVDLTQAAALLEAAGFTKPADTWLDPNGDPFTLEAYAPGGWTDVVVQMESIVAQLNAFGIVVELYTPDSTIYWSTPDGTYAGSHFDLAWEWWGAWNPHPYGSFMRFLWTFNGRPWSGIQFPEVVDGVNITDTLITLGETLDVTAQKALVLDLVTILNQELPIYPIGEKQMQIFHSTTRFLWPSETDPLWASYPGDAHGAIAAMMKTGKIVPRA